MKKFTFVEAAEFMNRCEAYSKNFNVTLAESVFMNMKPLVVVEDLEYYKLNEEEIYAWFYRFYVGD